MLGQTKIQDVICMCGCVDGVQQTKDLNVAANNKSQCTLPCCNWQCQCIHPEMCSSVPNVEQKFQDVAANSVCVLTLRCRALFRS